MQKIGNRLNHIIVIKKKLGRFDHGSWQIFSVGWNCKYKIHSFQNIKPVFIFVEFIKNDKTVIIMPFQR